MGVSKVLGESVYLATADAHQAKVLGQSVYVAVQDSPKVTLRGLGGYLAVRSPSKPQLRHVGGYLLYKAPPTLVFTTDGVARLLAQINKQYKLSLTTALVTFGEPAVESTRRQNTKVVLTATKSFSYRGTKTLYYDRYDISNAFTGKTTSSFTPVAGTVYGCLSQINTTFGLALTTRDVIDGSTQSTGLVLRAASGSYAFLPNTIQALGSVKPTMAEAFPVSDLPDF